MCWMERVRFVVDVNCVCRSKKTEAAQTLTLAMIETQETQDPTEESVPLFTLDSKFLFDHLCAVGVHTFW